MKRQEAESEARPAWQPPLWLAVSNDNRPRTPAREGESPSQANGAPAVPDDPGVFEGQYQKLGWFKGPQGAREAQEDVRRFWIAAGADGAARLLVRIRDERSVDVLDAVAEIVGEVGRTDEAAVAACLDVLNRRPSEEQENVALTALRWMAPPSDKWLGHWLLITLLGYLRQADPLLQEKAVLAARALPDASAEKLFATVLDEVEPSTREVIGEEHERRLRGA